MDKRYQVFVSSTFKDLEEERDTAVQTLMKIDSIPAGMELFPAADVDQFEFIKTIIDGSDYYVLIIGGKYGTVTEEGVSYTEKEYDYALEKNIPVLAFLHKNPDILISKNVERTQEAIDKLDAFRNKASNGRLVEFWENKDQLASQIIIGMTKATKMFPRVGWVRADKVSSLESLSDINELRKENDKLKKEIKELSSKDSESNLFDKFLDDNDFYKLSDIVRIESYVTSGAISNIMPIEVSLLDIFKIIAPQLSPSQPEDKMVKHVDNMLAKKVISKYALHNSKKSGSVHIPFEFIYRCKLHFVSLKLMTISLIEGGGSKDFEWIITDLGQLELFKSMAFIKDKT